MPVAVVTEGPYAADIGEVAAGVCPDCDQPAVHLSPVWVDVEDGRDICAAARSELVAVRLQCGHVFRRYVVEDAQVQFLR